MWQEGGPSLDPGPLPPTHFQQLPSPLCHPKVSIQWDIWSLVGFRPGKDHAIIKSRVLYSSFRLEDAFPVKDVGCVARAPVALAPAYGEGTCQQQATSAENAPGAATWGC